MQHTARARPKNMENMARGIRRFQISKKFRNKSTVRIVIKLLQVMAEKLDWKINAKSLRASLGVFLEQKYLRITDMFPLAPPN